MWPCRDSDDNVSHRPRPSCIYVYGRLQALQPADEQSVYSGSVRCRAACKTTKAVSCWSLSERRLIKNLCALIRTHTHTHTQYGTISIQQVFYHSHSYDRRNEHLFTILDITNSNLWYQLFALRRPLFNDIRNLNWELNSWFHYSKFLISLKSSRRNTNSWWHWLNIVIKLNRTRDNRNCE